MLKSRRVSAIALMLMVGALAMRGWLVVTGSFYWDDLILIGRSSEFGLLSWDFLGHSHDGHFMPAAFLAAGVTTILAPLNWALPAATLIAGQVVASLAVWRMIRILAPRAEAGALLVFAFYLFNPMTMPAFVWWSSGLNTLPMQAAMAWIVGDAVLACRTRDPRRLRVIAVRSAIIFLIALTFFEKSLYIAPVALAAATLAVRFSSGSDAPDGVPVRVRHRISPLATAVVSARPLWAALAVLAAIWAVLFLSVSGATAGIHSASQTAQLMWRSVNDAVVPSVVGGPWQWDRWNPSPPMGIAPTWMVIAGWLVVAGAAAWAVIRRQGAGWVIGLLGAYVVLAQVPVMWNRSSGNTALELAQTMRYLPDTALVVTIAIALVLAAPGRTGAGDGSPTGRTDAAFGAADDTDPPTDVRQAARTRPVVVGVVVVGALIVSSTVSLSAFGRAWRDNPTGDYLDTATAALAEDTSHAMFDQALPLEVLLPIAYPYNQISRTFGRVRARPDFGVVTDQLRVLDTAGRLVPGAVTAARTIAAGSGACNRPELTGPARLSLDGPLIRWPWTIALSYCADRDGRMRMWFDGGAALSVPVRAGLHMVYVQLGGQGRHLNLAPITPGLAMHTGQGRVGEVVQAGLFGN
ncbi:hypothetical protein QSJ18_14585 [Gordonia sp. ABSL1-1]|uniref:hypothetical protein n=1 Tax=Gordonia sp. ABSL1-1 TaxID=3053923 RepID=UPI002574696C|nr:hypothetical protein [Gordonia sp. ABSL1-1]MDL9937978.1 hypothetical protein [Gordonia sp. ABSL1-1]